MSETKLVKWSLRSGTNICSNDGRVVCQLHVGNPNIIKDAELITIAPDMLRACKAVLQWAEWDLESPYAMATKKLVEMIISKTEEKP